MAVKELTVEDKGKTFIDYNYCLRYLLHDHAVRKCKFTTYA